ncbi:MAG: thiol peroxidase [Parachlamydiales bacterium]|jgi:thiol peroxidase
MKKVTFKKKPITLVGRNIKINNYAPDFKVFGKDLEEASLSDFKDKIKIIHSFPSLDTQVCDLQVKEFNKRAKKLTDDVVVVSISKDLPFAQKRFCETFNIENIKVFSDYRTSSFGINYGLLIKELNLLARSALILDKNNVIRYIQIVDEITDSINYDDLLKNLDQVVKKPKVLPQDIVPLVKCMACEGKAAKISKDKINEALSELNNWQLVEDKKLIKEFKFKDFLEAKYFLDLLSIIADEENHHPVFTLNYNKLKVSLSTHAIDAISENDLAMAKIINEIKM